MEQTVEDAKNWLLQGITDVSENLNNIKLFFSIHRKKSPLVLVLHLPILLWSEILTYVLRFFLIF